MPQNLLNTISLVVKSHASLGAASKIHSILSCVIDNIGLQKAVSFVPEIAAYLEVNPSDIYKVLFLDMGFHKKEFDSRCTVQICTGPLCQLKGAKALNNAVEKWLDILPGQTTIDGCFYLKSCACMNACTKAPMIKVNQTFHGDLRQTQVSRILQSYLEEDGPEVQKKNLQKVYSPYQTIKDHSHE